MSGERTRRDRGTPVRLFDRARDTAFHYWGVMTRERERRALLLRVRKLETRWKEFRFRAKAEHAAMKRTSNVRHRRILSADIVHDLLPMRVRTIAARATHANATREDDRLQALSLEYRNALATLATPHPMLVKTDLQGLTWWVPVPPSLTGGALEGVVAKQRFPYRNITQTREFSIGPVFIDIGANIGRMSIPRVILGDIGRVYCAEPDPLNLRRAGPQHRGQRLARAGLARPGGDRIVVGPGALAARKIQRRASARPRRDGRGRRRCDLLPSR